MPAKITKLTADQIARMPEWVDRWVKIGLSTDPADFDAAEAAALKCYELAGLPKPRVVLRMSSPFGATLGGPLALALLGSKQVWSQVWSQVESQVRSQVGSQVESQVWSQVESRVGSQVRSQVESQVWSQVRSQVESQVWSQVWSQVGSQVRSQVGSQVWSQVESQVRSQVWSQVRSQVGSQVWSQVWSQVGSQVGSQVWSQVESQVRSQVGSQVESQVWSQVESRVGSQVESQVWSQVGSQVESQVGSAWQQYRGAQLWASWYAYISFFRDVCGWEEPALAKFAVDEILAKSCGWTWWHDDVVAISGRPTVLRRDGAGRLHADDGPALAYADGWSIFSWHGYAMPPGKEWIIAEKSRISPDLIDAEGNAELRRIMLEVFGFERYIEARGAVEIAADEMFGRPRRLLSMWVAGEEIRVIDVHNGSLEPDGSRRRFFLGALRGANTPHEAVAMSYGFDPKVYVEGVRT